MEFIDTTIGAISISTKTGKTPDTKEPLYYNGSIPWVTPTDLKGQQFISNTNTKISDLALIDNEAFLHKEDTILISCIGDIGKVAIVKEQVSSNQQITGVRVNESIIEPKFFYYWLVNNKEYLSFKANRVTIPILNNFNLHRLKIKIPIDKEYQSKIVFQLDTIQALIDLKIRITSILDDLIFSIYHKIFVYPINIKSKWSLKKLGDICDWKTGGTPSTNNSLNYEGTIPWFTSGELGNVFLEDSIKHISDQALSLSNAKIIKPFSLLIGLYDSAAFKMSITTKECACNQAVIYGKLPDEKTTVFLYYTLFLSKEFYLTKRKGARQKNLNSSFIKDIAVVYPTKKEEDEKVLLFFELHTVIQKIKEEQNTSLNLLRELFKSIMRNSFKENAQIEEEPIFKNLIKKFSIQDLQGNKQRLQYLINLFEQQNFDEFQDFTNARKILFELMESDQIIQVLDDGKVKLQVK